MLRVAFYFKKGMSFYFEKIKVNVYLFMEKEKAFPK